MARNKKIKGRRIDDPPEEVIEYKPSFSTYMGHVDRYKGIPVIFATCTKCLINYEYGDTYFPDEEQVCLYCLNEMKPPAEGKYDYILESDFIVSNEIDDDSYLIDEDCYEEYDDEELYE